MATLSELLQGRSFARGIGDVLDADNDAGGDDLVNLGKVIANSSVEVGPDTSGANADTGQVILKSQVVGSESQLFATTDAGHSYQLTPNDLGTLLNNDNDAGGQDIGNLGSLTLTAGWLTMINEGTTGIPDSGYARLASVSNGTTTEICAIGDGSGAVANQLSGVIQANSGLAVGGGSTLIKVMLGSGTFSGFVPASSVLTYNIPITGVLPGDRVTATPDLTGGALPTNCSFSVNGVFADNVQVAVTNSDPTNNQTIGSTPIYVEARRYA